MRTNRTTGGMGTIQYIQTTHSGDSCCIVAVPRTEKGEEETPCTGFRCVDDGSEGGGPVVGSDPFKVIIVGGGKGCEGPSSCWIGLGEG